MVMVCVHVAMFPQSSSAWYVRVMTSGHVLPSETSPRCVTVTGPQLSVAVTRVISAAGTSPMHSTVTAGGHVISGGVVSSMVMVCVHVAMFPQSSSAWYVRVITSGHVLPSETSPRCVTVTGPQLSVAVTRVISAAGTSPMHSTVTAGGHVISGGVISSMVMVCVHVAMFPQSSSAWYVRVMTS